MYKIEYASARIRRQLDNIPTSERENLLKDIETEIVKPLNKNIRPLEQFKKQNPKRSRLKLGDYRIIFSKDKHTMVITIYDIVLRRDAYR